MRSTEGGGATADAPQSSADHPSFTIVIPAKDEAGYIGRSLRSLRAQRATPDLPFHIVVVDCGSSDATVSEASPHADILITDCPVAAHSIGCARNVGAAATSSEFIFHTDADVVVPDLATLLARAVAAFGDPRVVALTVPVKPYPWDSTRRDRVLHRVGNGYLRLALLCGGLFSRGECQIVRRSAFDEVGQYSSTLTSGEDCDLFRRLHGLGTIVYQPDLCVFHSVRRFRHWGYCRTMAVYVREMLWLVVFGRSFLSSWPVVRE